MTELNDSKQYLFGLPQSGKLFIDILYFFV